jgi:hypothetical protein
MFCSENVIQILSKSMNSFLLTWGVHKKEQPPRYRFFHKPGSHCHQTFHSWHLLLCVTR